MTTILIWWMCSMHGCILHYATYADVASCQHKMTHNSICQTERRMP